MAWLSFKVSSLKLCLDWGMSQNALFAVKSDGETAVSC